MDRCGLLPQKLLCILRLQLADFASTPAVLAPVLIMGAVEVFFAPTEACFLWSANMFSARAGKASREQVTNQGNVHECAG